MLSRCDVPFLFLQFVINTHVTKSKYYVSDTELLCLQMIVTVKIQHLK